MNKIILTGRLVRDPETSYTTNQPPLEVARFDLAVDRKYKKKEEQKADFFRCICFGKYAGMVGAHKGSREQCSRSMAASLLNHC